ncbi:MAG: TonB-dependent receptor [Allosphingosinicella sp.]
MRHFICLALLALSAVPAAAQEISGEIIVTGMRRDADDYDDRIPAIGLRRTGDFAVQQVSIVGDTRDQAKRRAEIYEMIRGAIALAGRSGGVQLATGEMIVEPLTLANYRNLALSSDGRPDTDRVTFLVKTPLGGADARTALERIDAFIKAVPTVGRAEMRAVGDLTLSVVAPDQYRGRIVELVAADARDTAAKLGPAYAVEAKGLDRPVEWTRASLTEVFLYVPYSYTVVPAAR